MWDARHDLCSAENWQKQQCLKWNESGFRPPLCTYRLNWARRTSWGWWYDWDDTVLQTQDSKFEPWRSEAEHATYLSVTEAPYNTNFHTWMGKKHLCFFETAETGNRTRNSGVKGSGANHHPRAPAHNSVWLNKEFVEERILCNQAMANTSWWYYTRLGSLPSDYALLIW